MKVFIILCSILVFGFASGSDVTADEWQAFKVEFGKEYKGRAEDLQRFQIYSANKLKIEEHNKLFAEGKTTFEMGVNEFSDWTFEEFSKKMLMPKDSLEEMYNGTEFLETYNRIENLAIAPVVDWRSNGVVNVVKDQGQCGSCWAFAAVGTIESQWKLKSGKLVSLSEQNLVDCDRRSYGCNGGHHTYALNWVTRNGGINSEQTYPYEAKQGNCRFKSNNIAASIRGLANVQSRNENALQQAVANVGPVAVYIMVESGFQSYKSGIYSTRCNTDSINHAVLLVGYNLSSKYYIVKNSWGSRWGENGYIRMAIGSNLCNIATYGVYAVV